jgi:PAT family beta-lactamase induction signal transducer AmpG
MADENRWALADNGRLRAGLFCLLYFCQGFPWGFATIALLAILSEAGHGKAETSTIVALAILPWTFKFVWAPMIDSFRLPAYGIRRPWIAMAQVGMAATLLAAVTSGSFADDATLSFLAWVFFVHNCFASLQDVSTDALAVDLLGDRERGRVMGMMWGSKLVGISAGAAGLAIVAGRVGLPAAMVVQAAVILLVFTLVVGVVERAGEKRFPWSRGRAALHSHDVPMSLRVTARELRRALSVRTTWVALLFSAVYLLAEGIYDPLTAEQFVQGFGWTAEQYATAQGTFGVVAQLLGALLGGWVADRFGARRAILAGLLLVSAMLLTFSLTSPWWDDVGYGVVWLLPGFKGGMAFLSVAYFSMTMKICWTRAAATQFTLYMTVGNAGYALGAKLNEWVEWLPWTPGPADMYLLAGLLPVLSLALLPLLDPAGVEKRKFRDMEARLAAMEA